MPAEFWYRASGVWRKAKEVYYRHSGAWRKAKEIWYRAGGVWRKVFDAAASGFTSFVNPLSCQGKTHSSSDEGSAGVTLSVLPDGTWIIDSFSGWLYVNGTYMANSSGNWALPTTPGGGQSYYVQFELTGTSGSTTGTSWTTTTGWMQLTTTRSAGVSAMAVGSPRGRTATYTVRIASDSAGANVVAMATGVTLSASATVPPGN